LAEPEGLTYSSTVGSSRNNVVIEFAVFAEELGVEEDLAIESVFESFPVGGGGDGGGHVLRMAEGSRGGGSRGGACGLMRLGMQGLCMVLNLLGDLSSFRPPQIPNP